MGEMHEVVEASGTMNAAAIRRGEAALASRHTPDPVDISHLHAQLEALANEAGNDA